MYTFESRVRYSECDEQARLSLVGIVNYLQDCSTFQTEELGLGLEWLKEHDLAWLLAAWQIQIERLPRFTETIRLKSWCYKANRTLAQRCFAIEDAEGKPCVWADSLWFTFDTKEGKPCRIPESQNVYLEDLPRLELPPTERKLKTYDESVPGKPIVITSQHLDTNRHVNNAQYILMAQEALEEPFELRRICAQYRLQTREGDVLVPYVHREDGVANVELRGQADELIHAVVRLES